MNCARITDDLAYGVRGDLNFSQAKVDKAGPGRSGQASASGLVDATSPTLEIVCCLPWRAGTRLSPTAGAAAANATHTQII